MDARTAGREYDDFDPTTNWAIEDSFDTLLIYLPGFKKDQLKVQVSSAGNLRVLGERQVSGNKWSRFRKELPISSNYDSNKIGAKFDTGILHVKFPKIIVPAGPRGEAKPAAKPTQPPEPTPTAEPQKTRQKEDTKEPPKAEPPKAEPPKVEPPKAELPKAEKAPPKPTEEEKKPKKSTEAEEKPKEAKEKSKKADEAKIGPETALRQKSSEDLAEKKATEKDQKRGDTADIGKKMEKAGTKNASDIGKPKAKNYKESIGGSMAKLKKPRNLMNALVAALLIVVLGLYVKYALRSLGTTKSDPEL